MEKTAADGEKRPSKGSKWKRRTFLGALGAVGVFGGAVTSFGYKFSVAPYRGPVSDHFNGEKFFNPGGEGPHGLVDLMKWILNRDIGPWKEFTDAPPGAPPPKRVAKGDLRVTFVNHSSVLIQMDGINILTDPVWSERISPVSFTGPRRHRPVGIRFQDLPPIDIILLSHNHYDHLDAPTMTRLAATHRPRVYTALGNSAFLNTIDVPNATDMDWWDAIDLGGGMRLTCMPARHFSNRGTFDRDTTLWCGFMLEGPAGQVYFAGDSGTGPHFEEIGRRFPSIRLALLPIGAYRPRWFMSPVHMGPDDAVRVHRTLKASRSMGIHFGTFAQADDGETEPVELMNATLDTLGIPRDRFRALENGEGWDVPPFSA
ncbi:MAG: hypothetical protein JWQ98_3016 [Chlorobi bacterium]|nr:hypothetical protein [Chlorobiota bacterium]